MALDRMRNNVDKVTVQVCRRCGVVAWGNRCLSCRDNTLDFDEVSTRYPFLTLVRELACVGIDVKFACNS